MASRLCGLGVIGEGKLLKQLTSQLEQEAVCSHLKLMASLALDESADTGAASHDVDDVINSDAVDIVVVATARVMPAYDMCRQALEMGKHVVTNNATMLAAHGEKLWRLAADKNVHLRFEAAVLGGAPILDGLFNHFQTQGVHRVYGSINVTSNYALMRMKDNDDTFADALSDAAELGYAEKDPYVDVTGKDSLYRFSLLHLAAFGRWCNLSAQRVMGIEGVKDVDIKLAQKLGCNIKLLAQTDGSAVTVAPALLEEYAQIGNLSGTLAGVVVESSNTGPVFSCAHAADDAGVASAMVGDCIKISQGQRPWKLVERNVTTPEKDQYKRYFLRSSEEDAKVVAVSNHFQLIEECFVTLKGQNHKGCVFETSMPKNELIQFFEHDNMQSEYYLMDVFKE